MLTAALGPFEMCDDVSAEVFDKVVSEKIMNKSLLGIFMQI